MVRCEMCGTETESPTTVKVEGAELEVCDACTTFGTEVDSTSSETTETKYSTTSDATDDSTTTQRPTGQAGSGGDSGDGRRRDMFDEMDELVQDYHQRIRQAREDRSLSQDELADQLNEKASLIRKLEHGDTLPSDDIQRKLERALDIELSARGDTETETDWESDSSTGSYTLGDVVERED